MIAFRNDIESNDSYLAIPQYINNNAKPCKLIGRYKL